ncbi:hypothetical protein V2J09_012156 [Rumex salicifolius]
MSLECCSLRNTNPSNFGSVPLRRPSFSCFSSPPSLLSVRRNRLLFLSAVSSRNSPIGLCGSALISESNRRSILPLAASQEDSTPLDVEYENEKRGQEEQGKESEEAWERALAGFKEQALRLQSVSQEAYEVYSKKAMVALKETAVQLKIEADKARYDLTIMAQELGEDGKLYMAQAAENSPEPVKDVVETFAYATDNVKDVSEVRDFYIGIPYGAILSLGGFLDFMVTGRTSAIRFGVILGGALLALSLSSLKSWRKSKQTDGVILKCETAIAGILFVREFRLFFQKMSFSGLIGAAISGAIAAFFVYRLLNDQHADGSNADSFDEDARGSSIDGEPQI